MTLELVARSLLHFLWQGALLGAIAALGLKIAPLRHRYVFACGMLLAMAWAPIVTLLVLSSPEAGSSPAAFSVMKQVSGGAAIALPADSNLFPAVLGCWLAGVFFFSARAVGGWILATRRMSVREAVDPGIADAARRIAGRMGVSQAVRIFASRKVDSPAVFGAWKPVILLPLSTIAGLNPAQLEAILAHELAHVARHDFLVNCLQCAIESLLFYHPAVWWLSRRIREEREMCCDAVAADFCGDRVLYSRALLTLEEGRREGELSLAANGGDLRARIERLLGVAPPARRYPPLGPALSAVVLAAVATVAALQAQTPARADSPYAHWLNEDVVYIIAPQERAAFERLNTNEEREHFIEQFWLRRDPTPGTPANEFKKEHYRRIGYAMERFRSPTKSGWATERGNLYIVTGPPDEIEAHPAELYEIWRSRDGRELEFRGKEYELTRSKPAR